MNDDLPSTEDEKIARRIEMLRSLHTHYTDEEMRQCYDNLIHYFDMVWRFYERMLKDGTLDALFDNKSKSPYASKAKVEPRQIDH